MKKLYITLLLALSTLTNASTTSDYKAFDEDLSKQLMKFVNESSEIAGATTYTPRYIVKYHERVNLIASYRDFAKLLHKHDNEISELKSRARKGQDAKALSAIALKVTKYKYLSSLVNYMMMSGENFISVFSDDFEDINYKSKNFEKDFKAVKRENYNSKNQTSNHGSRDRRNNFRYKLKYINNATIKDFKLLDRRIEKMAKSEGQEDILTYIRDSIAEYEKELSTYKSLLKEISWNVGSYNILYGLKEFILKSFSYIAIPMNHAIKEEELERVAQSEFLPGDIGAIQRYGKLSNLVFKGNWTHGLMYIGKYSKFESYFNNDKETNDLFAKKCIQEELDCTSYMSYLAAKYPKHIKEYKKSEEKGRPYVTLEGLKPGVVFMELAPSMAWDNLVILRPNLSVKDKALALERTFSSIGKKYDYSFNGNTYSRFVCTELIQYSYEENPYENKKGIDWDVNMVMGKPAMYGFDLVKTFINQEEDSTRKKQLSLVIYMKGIKKKDLKLMMKPAEFGTSRRGTIQELKETL